MPLTRLLQIKVLYSQIPSLLCAQPAILGILQRDVEVAVHSVFAGFLTMGAQPWTSAAFPETNRQLFRGKLLVN